MANQQNQDQSDRNRGGSQDGRGSREQGDDENLSKRRRGGAAGPEQRRRTQPEPLVSGYLVTEPWSTARACASSPRGPRRRPASPVKYSSYTYLPSFQQELIRVFRERTAEPLSLRNTTTLT